MERLSHMKALSQIALYVIGLILFRSAIRDLAVIWLGFRFACFLISTPSDSAAVAPVPDRQSEKIAKTY